MTTAIDPSSRTLPAVWDGFALLNAFTGAANHLIANQRHLNALNVFPVPDGDTGTNMALTMRAAIDETTKLAPTERCEAGSVAARIEAGSLMGARGNSGVILSQMLRGFARAIAGRTTIDAGDIARSFAGSRDAAYNAVMEPVEGTMLTVTRLAADYAANASEQGASIAAVTAAALRGAEIALADTPNLLPKLRDAGVVDAGGQGVVYLLDGLDRYARGESVPELLAGDSGDFAGSMEFLDRIAEIHGEDDSGYCTNFMIFGTDIPFDLIRRELAQMGSSAVIVGDENLVKVHIHTDDPGRLLTYAIRFGDLGQIKIDNMNSQLESLVERRASAATLVLPTTPSAECGRIGVVAVASGSGIVAALQSMGASTVIEGGRTMNPSIEKLLAAVESLPTNEVILLPNNPNILLSAARVPDLSQKRVVVVPSHSIPQALAALETFNDDQPLDDLVDTMTCAARSVRTVEVALVDRDATGDGIAVKKGEYAGLLDDRLVATGEEPAEVALATIKLGGGDEAELITVFIGDNGPAAESDPIRRLLDASFENAEIQIYHGGQPQYRYIIAVE